MIAIDRKRELKQLYSPSAKEFSIVQIPEMSFLMVDGAGNPNTAPAFAQAVETLFGVAYALKFMLKKGPLALDVPVMPLEGLWWAEDMAAFTVVDKDSWQWTLMIAQPPEVSRDMYQQALAQTAKKKPELPLAGLRLERFAEGLSVQIMHVGPFAAEAPTIARMHEFIEQQGYRPSGKHHEIYLSDMRRTAPEKLKTVIRQPIEHARREGR